MSYQVSDPTLLPPATPPPPLLAWAQKNALAVTAFTLIMIANYKTKPRRRRKNNKRRRIS
jgi:hypothetical protein